ncbi:hypothetical protein MMC09_003166 [Bachmanniomyces sp. S44760]|nr:hypothetical protein [Bachmanniomyces sp. S44760]
MGPRKKVKPNPEAELKPLEGTYQTVKEEDSQARIPGVGHVPAFVDGQGSTDVDESPSSTRESAVALEISTPTQRNDGAAREPSRSEQAAKSWYSGTWPRKPKAAPVSQLAGGSISAAGNMAAEIVSSTRSHTPTGSIRSLKSPAVYLSRSLGSSSRSLPLTATTTKLNVTSNAQSSNEMPNDRQSSNPGCDPLTSGEPQDAVKERSERFEAHSTPIDDVSLTGMKIDHSIGPDIDKRSSWLDWFSKPNPPPGEQIYQQPEPHTMTSSSGHGAGQDQTMSNSTQHTPDSPAQQRRRSDPIPRSEASIMEQSRSWRGIWGSPVPPVLQKKDVDDTSPASRSDLQTTPDGLGIVPPSTTVKVSEDSEPTQNSRDSKSSGWAFWSRNSGQDGAVGSAVSSSAGELAVSSPPSLKKPESVVSDVSRDRPKSIIKSDNAGKQGALDSGKVGTSAQTVEITEQAKKNAIAVPLQPEPMTAKAKKMQPNLLLPSFKQTYQITDNPGLFQQLLRLFVNNKLVAETKHVSLLRDPPRIKRALAIGVHGYFPAPLIRTVLGQPTGTSIRFADSAAEAIQHWCQDRGYTCEVEKIALEGEGRIAERIELLWKLMLNWIENLRKADFILVACHSQGVPVAIMLIAKLIAFGCVHGARIGVCAMAGTNLGPFMEYKSRWISGSAGELFDFARPDSQVSRDYEAALETCLRFGVRAVFVGSIDDQLVSLESSTFGLVSHPYVYRAVFVDGRVHAPDFLTHLVGFALKLRNLGVPDHGLIRELSTPLAGSLYGGEGHSRIYDDPAVYYLAVEHALETTSLGDVPIHISSPTNVTSQNPYILPFAMRGLLEEDFVRTKLYDETIELLRQFDNWRPTTKVLKDVKFRLEGVRSKL